LTVDNDSSIFDSTFFKFVASGVFIMHMADALLSPAVGASMWAVAAGTIAYSSRKVAKTIDDRRIPLMGILGAFVFAAQMINFTIPGTGSSGHIGGGLLLAILLGPHAAYLTLSSVLIVQALFFADGGLLALGCNIVNLGLFPCFIAYPFFYQKLAGDGAVRGRVVAVSIIAAVIGLQFGSLSVVTQTVMSEVTDLPFKTFAMVMQPIHLAIGVVEGVATAAVVLFVSTARPDILQATTLLQPGEKSFRRIGVALLLVTLLTGGFVSWYASDLPDGLEWSIAKVTGSTEIEAPNVGAHKMAEEVQTVTTVLPDYALPNEEENGRTGTTLSGLVGSLLVLLLTGGGAAWLKRRNKKSAAVNNR
jgi:cobalt/nickel transport system permease protein